MVFIAKTRLHFVVHRGVGYCAAIRTLSAAGGYLQHEPSQSLLAMVAW